MVSHKQSRRWVRIGKLGRIKALKKLYAGDLRRKILDKLNQSERGE